MTYKNRFAWRKTAVAAASLSCAVVIAGSAQAFVGEAFKDVGGQAAGAAMPKTPVQKSYTSFTPALRCMDDLFLQNNTKDKNLWITTVGIPDATNKVSAGTREMLINALSRMTRTSKAIKYIDYSDTAGTELQNLFLKMESMGTQYDAPRFYIRGAISQLDDNAIDSQKGGGLALPFLDLGVSKGDTASVVTLDMTIGDASTREILPDTAVSNSMVVIKSDKGGEGGGKIGKLGLHMNVSINKSEGTGAAVRALIELGLIEMIGKWAEVPYWNCLGLDETSPLAQEQIRERYDNLNEGERIRWAQEALRRSKLSEADKPAVTGKMDESTRDAILKWQVLAGLVPSGRIDFDLYRELSSKTATLVAPPEKKEEPPKKSAPTPVSLRLTADRPQYRVKEVLNATAELSGPASGFGYMYCYYKDENGAIARIFPNRFVADPKVRYNDKVAIANKGFKIQFAKAGVTEQVMCLGSSAEIALPPQLQAGDLVPLPVRSMDEVINAFKRSSPAAKEAVLDISVVR